MWYLAISQYRTPIEQTYPVLLDDMPEPKVYTYSLETVVAENFQILYSFSSFSFRAISSFQCFMASCSPMSIMRSLFLLPKLEAS